MKLSGWDKVFALWEKTFYTDLFVFACLFVAIVIGIKFWRKEAIFLLFFFYTISAFILLFSCDIVRPFLNLKSKQNSIFNETGATFFALLEYIVFCIFFNKALKSNIAKKLSILFILIYVIASSLFVMKEFDNSFSRNQINHYSDMIVSSELLLLCVFSIIYYYELLKKSPLVELLKSPSFWIVSGLFFYCLLISSFLIISENFIKKYDQVHAVFYATHYISFGLLFLAITKAFLCKKPLTT